MEPRSLGMVVGNGADLAVSLAVCMTIGLDHQAHQHDVAPRFHNALWKTRKLVRWTDGRTPLGPDLKLLALLHGMDNGMHDRNIGRS